MSGIDRFIDYAANMMTCPICLRRFERQEIKIVGYLDSLAILEAECSRHQPNSLAKFFASRVNDQPHRRLTSDDLINFYQELEQFNGRFDQLFAKPKEDHGQHQITGSSPGS